jgi:hypothetical protein
MPFPELDPEDYWREPSGAIEAGDLFAEVPLLTLSRDDLIITHEDQMFLPTRVAPLALLLKIHYASWWFVPVVTREAFRDADLYNDLVEQCNRGERPGWCLLPPLDGYPPLRDFALAVTLQPTLHRAVTFEDSHAWRVASLTPTAHETVCAAFLEGFAAPEP